MVTVPEVVGFQVMVYAFPTGTASPTLGFEMGLHESVHSVV